MGFLRILSKKIYTISLGVFTLSLLLGVYGCGTSSPTKETIVSILYDLNTALSAKDYKKAAEFLQPIPNLTPKKLMSSLDSFQKNNEISEAGIAILAEKGKFGPLLEIFPKSGVRFAKQAGVDAGKCYALGHNGAEVAAHWDGKDFLLIRLDDIVKLQ